MGSSTSPGDNSARSTRPSTRPAVAYLAWDRWISRLTLGFQGVADGVFLGVADERTLDRLDEQYYLRTPYYLTDAYNQRGLFDWERQAIERHFPASGRVIVIGAGGGREVIALGGLGYDPVGYEPNDALARFGRELLDRTGAPGEIVAMTRNRWPTDPAPVDAVIIGWGVYHSLRTSPVRIAFLRAMRDDLDADTPVLISFFTRRGAPVYQRTVASVGSAIRRIRRRPPIELGDVLTPFFAHQFADGEIDAELTEAGLRVVDHGDDGYGWAIAAIDPRRTPNEGATP